MTAKRIYILSVCALACLTGKAQTEPREAEVSDSITIMVEEEMTWAQAKRKAIATAKAKAIEKEFGTYVNDAMIIQEMENDGKVSSGFVNLTVEESKGDWLGDTKQPELTVEYNNDRLFLTAKVWGKAREIKQAKTDIDWKIINKTNATTPTTTFISGENMYVSFKSPVDGYLAIYLIDTELAYCLLPYKGMTEGAYKVEAGKTNIFFDKNRDLLSRGMIMKTTQGAETNEVVLIFSPNPFTKPIDNRRRFNNPNSLSPVEFNDWLLKCRLQDREMVVQKHIIKIINNKQ